MNVTTVTIEKAYLETLMRRAELHGHVSPNANAQLLAHITIPRQEYELLCKQREEYAALKQSLFDGGITQETLDVLVHKPSADDAAVEGPVSDKGNRQPEQDSDGVHGWTQVGKPLPHTAKHQPQPVDQAHQSYSYGEGYYDSPEQENDGFIYAAYDQGPVYALAPDMGDKVHFARNEDRTIRLKNVSDNVQVQEIVRAVRGGQLLDICMRPAEKAYNISFVQGSDAEAFLSHCRRNDLYIGAKRIDVSHADRSIALPNHVAYKIKTGATRNLVIRNASTTYFSSKTIRDDLNHIHQMVVISVEHDMGDVYISTNSVNNALFARTCMMSRTMYRGKKIEFYPDECAEPLPEASHYNSRRTPLASLPAKKLNPLANRFEMLNIEGTEDGSSTVSETDGGVPTQSLAGDSLTPKTIRV